jgi:hypothetical protein
MALIEIVPQTSTNAARKNVVYHRGPENLQVFLWITAVGATVTVQMDEWAVGGAQADPYVVPEDQTTMFVFELGDGRGLSILPTAGATAVYRAAVSKP